MRTPRVLFAAVCLSLCAVPLSAQVTAKTPGKDVAPAASAPIAARAVYTRSCPKMIPAQILQLPDGGYLETEQGWFNSAWTDKDFLWCQYGVDGARPADRPAGRVHYDLAGHKSADCKVVGQTITCTK